MAPRESQHVLPSLIDRVVEGRTPAVTEEGTLRELRQAVRRDVEALLNTRRRAVSPPAGQNHLKDSLLEYGIPDSSAANLSTLDERKRFVRELEASLKRYESRFKNVRVELLDDGSEIDRVLRFRIEAVLRAEPVPEPVGFESFVEPLSRRLEIRG